MMIRTFSAGGAGGQVDELCCFDLSRPFWLQQGLLWPIPVIVMMIMITESKQYTTLREFPFPLKGSSGHLALKGLSTTS